MNVLMALAIALVFGAGTVLLLRRDLIQVAVGVFLVSSAANLTLMAVRLSGGEAPVYPLAGGPGRAADPLVQALTLTALVINFGASALLLALVYRFYTTHGSVDKRDLRRAEEETETEEEVREEREVRERTEAR